jgi:asparagine N-glycosylation enzyme membrane subunit Stt3
LGVAGAWVLRGRRLPLAPFAVVLGEVVVVAVAIFGQTRYRTPLDVVLVILSGVALERLLDRLVDRRASWSRGAHAVTTRGR